jgi:thioredoxin reductase (NADPH)
MIELMATGDSSTELPLDPADPYAREAQTFPRLSQEMARTVAAYGREERVASGTLLFERGQRSIDFFLVLDGAIEIFETDLKGVPRIFTVHRAGQFTGEMDLFNDRQILVSGRAREESRVVRVKRADFRRLIANEPDIGEIIMRAFILRRVGIIRHTQGGVELVGPGHGADTLRLQRFMVRNGYPHRLLDTERDPDAAGFLDCFKITPDQLPVLVLPGKILLRNPSNAALADALGLTEVLDPLKIYDVAVVGAGPAGLAAAVYAASEGLSTLVLEITAPGGQAGTSSKIENYLGFPTGISGQALAGRAQSQAQKFGARLAVARTVVGIECAGLPYRLDLDGGQSVQARAVVVATGARYRKLALENYEKYEGQAAFFLSRTVRHVHVIVRGPGLAATMSDYLVQRILTSPRMTVHGSSEITRLAGDRFLREVTWVNRTSGEATTRPIENLFLMIGAKPNSEWLAQCLTLDAKGFVKTGRDEKGQALASPFATTQPGVFAVGDVRSGSVKRVASSVGEGSVVVQAIHQFLNPGVA